MPDLRRFSWVHALAWAGVLLILGCASPTGPLRSEADAFTDALEAAVDAHISDGERRAHAKACLVELRSTVTAFGEDLTALRYDWRTLNTDYDTSRGQFDALAERARASRRRHSQSLTDIAMRARDVLGSAEWSVMYEDVEAAVETQWATTEDATGKED